jgi:hypothetical protein
MPTPHEAELYVSGDAAPPLDGSWPIRDMGLLSRLTVRDLNVAGTRAEWLSFDIAAPTVLVIDAVEVSDSDPLMILYDAGGQQIAFNDDANDSLEQPDPAAARCRALSSCRTAVFRCPRRA